MSSHIWKVLWMGRPGAVLGPQVPGAQSGRHGLGPSCAHGRCRSLAPRLLRCRLARSGAGLPRLWPGVVPCSREPGAEQVPRKRFLPPPPAATLPPPTAPHLLLKCPHVVRPCLTPCLPWGRGPDVHHVALRLPAARACPKAAPLLHGLEGLACLGAAAPLLPVDPGTPTSLLRGQGATLPFAPFYRAALGSATLSLLRMTLAAVPHVP